MRLSGRVVAQDFAHEHDGHVNGASIAIDGEMAGSLL